MSNPHRIAVVACAAVIASVLGLNAAPARAVGVGAVVWARSDVLEAATMVVMNVIRIPSDFITLPKDFLRKIFGFMFNCSWGGNRAPRSSAAETNDGQ